MNMRAGFKTCRAEVKRLIWLSARDGLYTIVSTPQTTVHSKRHIELLTRADVILARFQHDRARLIFPSASQLKVKIRQGAHCWINSTDF